MTALIPCASCGQPTRHHRTREERVVRGPESFWAQVFECLACGAARVFGANAQPTKMNHRRPS